MTHSFSEQKHILIQNCVDTTTELFTKIFENESTQQSLRAKFNILNDVDMNSAQLKNEVKDYLFGANGHSAGLFKMLARAKGFNDIYQILDSKKKQFKETPSGVIKLHLVNAIESQFMQDELKLLNKANQSWQSQLSALNKTF